MDTWLLTWLINNILVTQVINPFGHEESRLERPHGFAPFGLRVKVGGDISLVKLDM